MTTPYFNIYREPKKTVTKRTKYRQWVMQIGILFLVVWWVSLFVRLS